jgi:hypothetical protein
VNNFHPLNLNNLCYCFLNERDKELTQYRWPVVSCGPSGKTCPKWPPQLVQVISVLTIPCAVSSVYVTIPSRAWSKLGQPHPLSYLRLDENNTDSQFAHAYSPFSLLWSKVPLKGVSVALLNKTSCCSLVRFLFLIHLVY